MKNIKYKSFVVGPVMSNAYLFYNELTKDAIIFDIGGNPSQVVNFLNENGLKLKYIILTHGHGDHILGVSALQEKTGAKTVGYVKELEMFKNPEYNLSGHMGVRVSLVPDIIIKEEGKLKLDDWEMTLYHTPGHTKGSVCLLMGNYFITGDTLFNGSIGRTDFYGGDIKEMMESLKMFKEFDRDILVLPGHEGISTIGEELDYNPFLRNLR